jgi:alkanesulfonate monooxygenase SsuD/methylene tetrahydromethanopterin reductase-like flavin-dependent oxidoreductase (luciferase family)
MEFGVFHEFPHRDGQSDAEAFREAFEIVDAAERWGLDVMWLAELHFVARSVLAMPMTIAAGIAGRTKRLKIGTAVQVLPLCDPLRLAEEAATVDQLSQGRLIYGVGRSGFAWTYNAYGIPYGESRERFAEALAVIMKAWTEPTFSYTGRWHSYENVMMTPKPYQKPHPPVRVAATTPDTFPVLGEQGHALFAAVRLGTISDLLPDLEAYRAAYRAAGHTGQPEVFLRIPLYIADTAEQAIAEPEQSMMAFYRNMANQLAESAALEGVRASELRGERSEALAHLTFEQARREKVVVGTAEQVTERLLELREELGLAGILAELNCGGQIPHEQVMRSLRLLCTKVMPHFK